MGPELIVQAEVIALLVQVDVVIRQKAAIRQHRAAIRHEAVPIDDGLSIMDDCR
jgi:hypothetical protein